MKTLEKSLIGLGALLSGTKEYRKDVAAHVMNTIWDYCDDDNDYILPVSFVKRIADIDSLILSGFAQKLENDLVKIRRQESFGNPHGLDKPDM